MNARSSPAPDARMEPAGDLRLALTTAPPGEAEAIARALVEEGLAACVSLVPGLRSVYRWQGAVCDEPETLLLLKTTAARLASLACRLAELHPYEVPELLAWTPDQGLGPYLDWVRAQAATAGAEASDPPG